MKLKWLIIILAVAMLFIVTLSLPRIIEILSVKGTGEKDVSGKQPAIGATPTKENTVFPTALTTEEKRKIGLDENLKVSAVKRDAAGNVLIYQVDKTGLPKDSDGDGLADEKEKTIGTDPNNKDTDKDGMPDGQEVLLKFNPLDPQSPLPKK